MWSVSWLLFLISFNWEYDCLLANFVSVIYKRNPFCIILYEQFFWLPWRDKVATQGGVRTRSCFHPKMYITSVLHSSLTQAWLRDLKEPNRFGKKDLKSVPEEGSLIHPHISHCYLSLLSELAKLGSRQGMHIPFLSPCHWLLTFLLVLSCISFF